MTTSNLILCAIDTPELARARALASALAGVVGGIKLGLEFFVANGPAGVASVTSGDLPLFLDLKLHDIPNTVAGAVRSAAALQPMLLTLQASGGPAMMRAAVEAADAVAAAGKRRTKLLGVTVLTSLDDGDLDAVGQQGPVGEQVRRLALLARDSGLDGVVCSPQEVAMLRRVCGPDFLLVVPGIRPAGAATGDQKRVMGPRAAMQAGADYLVVGRPITEATHPAAAAQAILERAQMSVAAKICGLSTAAAVDAAVTGGARFVGFVFYPPSPRNVTPEQAAALAAPVPRRVTRVGLFVDASDAILEGVLARVPLDLLQFHGSEDPRRVAEVKSRFRKPVMKAIPIAGPGDPDAAIPYLEVADWLLFDAKPPRADAGALPGGNGLAFDWQLLSGRSWSRPWMLSGGLTARNLAEAVAITGATTVDVSSGVEIRQGIKDLGKIADFLAVARALP